jgi:predicted nucleic acid-binding protein
MPAWQQGREAVARQYETLLVNFPNLEVVDVTRTAARRAARLRARFRLRPADGLQVAAGLVSGASAFVTNDSSLRLLQEVIDVVVVDDFRLAPQV